jgi:purine-nucleoside phosphorylase
MPLPELARLDKAVASLHERTGQPPQVQVGVVLGSGLGDFADSLDDARPVSYSDIAGMPQPKVSGHVGRLVFGKVDGAQVACLQGRVHAYEGHAPADVVFGVCMLARLGCKAVLVTNAAGGLADDMRPADLMLITDHLNLTGTSPLLGPAREGLERFPDMTNAYDRELARAARGCAQGLAIALREGTYAGMLGPSYETPAEIRMLRTLGASAVGMSTVLEVLALRQLGVRVGAISCITNLAAGLSDAELSHSEVKEAAALARERFTRLLAAWLGKTAQLVAS